MKIAKEMIKESIEGIWDYLYGKKTYLVAIAGLIWGMYSGSEEVILTSLGLLGLRHGIASEASKILAKKKK